MGTRGSQFIATPGLLGYLWGFLSVAWEVLTQKWANRRLRPSSLDYCHPSVKGKTAIITGPTSGIGKETARSLALSGTRVVLACRNIKAGADLLQQWRKECGDSVHGEVLHLDLSSLASVRSFAASWEARKVPLHVLINNAGVFNMGAPRRVTSEGTEEHWAVNFLAPTLLSLLLLPSLLRGSPSRIVNVASKMHELGSLDLTDPEFATGRRRFISEAAYSQSKLAQVMFSSALHRRLPQHRHVDVVSLHPGEALTNVARSQPLLITAQKWLISGLLLTCDEGARPCTFAATDPQVADHGALCRRLRWTYGPYYDSGCQLACVAKHAVDQDAQEGLWTATLRWLGVEETFLDTFLTTRTEEEGLYGAANGRTAEQ